jgi:hypothetical protein
MAVTIPTSPGFNKMKAIYRRNTAMSISPYNFTQQVYAWKGGDIKVVECSLPPMKTTDATNWITFFNSCNGYEETFNLDISKAFPNESGMTSVAMRLVDTDQSWDIDTAQLYGISFICMEAK